MRRGLFVTGRGIYALIAFTISTGFAVVLAGVLVLSVSIGGGGLFDVIVGALVAVSIVFAVISYVILRRETWAG